MTGEDAGDVYTTGPDSERAPAVSSERRAGETEGARLRSPGAYEVDDALAPFNRVIKDVDGRILAIVPRRYELDRYPSLEELGQRAKRFAAAPALIDALQRMQSFSFARVEQREGYQEALRQWCEIKRAARRALGLAGVRLEARS